MPLPRNAQGLPTLAPILRGVTPAVVNISVTTPTHGRGNPLLKDPFFRRFFNLPEQDSEQEQSAGSGVIIDAAQGFILTNHHVIENAQQVVVTLKDGRRFSAQLVGSDPGTDIALVKIPAENLTALEVGDSDGLEVGDFVIAIGNPFGLGQTVTSGIVSALGRSGINVKGYEDFIQTDASINPGNSGGALVDLRGRLVGINTAIIGPSGGNVGIGFAVPTKMAVSVMDQLVAHGEVRRGKLGIQIQELDARLIDALDLAPGTKGVVVTRVEKASSAEQAGLQPGDVIIEIDGRPLETLTDVRNHVGLTPIGETVRMTILRDNREGEVDVVVGSSHRAELSQRSSPRPGEEKVTEMRVPQLAGAVFRDLEPGELGEDVAGVLVEDVERDSPAWTQGLRPGDLIYGLNRARVRNLEQLARVLRSSGDTLAFNIVREDSQLFIIIQ